MLATARSGLVLRAEATTSSAKLGLIPYGDTVEKIETTGQTTTIGGKSGKWTRVRYNDTTGWVFGGFLADAKSQKGQALTSTQIKAQFKSFSLGDAEHYEFVDENGKNWSFSSNRSKINFGIELPESQSNSENQGWGPNKKLINKWFTITWKNNKQPQYPDGPVVSVPIILSAKPTIE